MSTCTMAELSRHTRQVLAERAVATIQAESVARGLDKLTLGDINAEIAATRQERHARSA